MITDEEFLRRKEIYPLLSDEQLRSETFSSDRLDELLNKVNEILDVVKS